MIPPVQEINIEFLDGSKYQIDPKYAYRIGTVSGLKGNVLIKVERNPPVDRVKSMKDSFQEETRSFSFASVSDPVESNEKLIEIIPIPESDHISGLNYHNDVEEGQYGTAMIAVEEYVWQLFVSKNNDQLPVHILKSYDDKLISNKYDYSHIIRNGFSAQSLDGQGTSFPSGLKRSKIMSTGLEDGDTIYIYENKIGTIRVDKTSN